MLPSRLAPYFFGLLLSGMMSCLVSGIATYRASGMVEGFFALWMEAWIFSWMVAFPTLVLARPMVHRFVSRICAPDPAND